MTMKRFTVIFTIFLICQILATAKKQQAIDLWPDGTEISEWFKDTSPVDISKLGSQYKVTDYGVINDGRVHTQEFQALIDKVAADGGGVIVVPEGTYLTGAIFFKPGTHLYIKKGGTLMGSNDPSD